MYIDIFLLEISGLEVYFDQREGQSRFTVVWGGKGQVVVVVLVTSQIYLVLNNTSPSPRSSRDCFLKCKRLNFCQTGLSLIKGGCCCLASG